MSCDVFYVISECHLQIMYIHNVHTMPVYVNLTCTLGSSFAVVPDTNATRPLDSTIARPLRSGENTMSMATSTSPSGSAKRRREKLL